MISPVQARLDAAARLLGEAETLSLGSPGAYIAKSGIRTLTDYVASQELDVAESGARKARIIRTYIRELDEAIDGLQPTLTILGGLPGVGKSALIATLAYNLASHGKKIGLFSLEDDGGWLSWRLLALESGIPQRELRWAALTDKQHILAGAGFLKLRKYSDMILVSDDHGLSPEKIVAQAESMIFDHGAQVIIVDHVGEIRMGISRRDDLAIAEGLSDLREIANAHGIPVIVACHLARRADEPDREPRLSDFANAAAIERQARVALAVTRGPESQDLRIHVLKNTNGPAGQFVDVKFDPIPAMAGLGFAVNAANEVHSGSK